MSFGLEEIAEQNRRDVESAILEAERAKNEAEAQAILLGAIAEVRDAVSEIAVEHVTVDNLDEVQAAIHNELKKISKPIIAALEKLNLSEGRINQIKADLDQKNRAAINESHDIQIIKKPRQRITVDNLSDMVFPESLKVTNFEELKQSFKDLEECIKNLYGFEIPIPQVTVEAPIVNIPEIRVPEQSVNIDFKSILKALDPLKFLSDRAKKPLSVRLSDGKDFIKAIRTVVENQEKQMAAFSQGLNESGATKAFRRALDTGVKFAKIDAATSGDNTLVAAVAGKKIRVISLLLVSSGTVNVRFESGASGTALTGQMNLIANTGFSMNWNPGGWFETAAGSLLNLELSGATSVDGSLSYVEV